MAGTSNLIVIDRPELVGPWVAERVNATYREGDTAIGLLSPDGELLAGVLYQNFNGANICAHIAGTPGGKWLNRSFLWMIFDYPFNQLGVKRITGFVPASNAAARAFDERLGFVPEATLQDMLPGDDLIVYRMRRSECRWLTLKEKVYGIGDCR